MPRDVNPDSLNSRLFDAAEDVCASREAENRAVLLERLSDHPELHRGLKYLFPRTAFMASLLDDETLVRLMTEGLEYEDKRKEYWALRHELTDEGRDAALKFKEDIKELREGFKKMAQEDSDDDGGLSEELTLREARIEFKYKVGRKSRQERRKALDQKYDAYLNYDKRYDEDGNLI